MTNEDADLIAVIEGAWVKNHATEAPRNATADIRALLRIFKAELERSAVIRKDLKASIHVVSAALDQERERAMQLRAVALKNANAAVAAQADIVQLEDLLASVRRALEDPMRLGAHYQWTDDDADRLRRLLGNGASSHGK